MLEELNQLLNTHQRILFIGVGNVLKQDDGAGVYISERIDQTNQIQTLTAGQSFENYIGTVQKLNPDILVILDCVDFNKSPGESFMISLKDLFDHTSNTHNISMKTFSIFFDIPVKILGIQPQTVDYGEKISPVVKKKADQIISIINGKK